MRRIRRLAQILVPLSAVALCSTSCSESPPDTPNGTAASGLEGFVSQQVQWIPCGEGDTQNWFPAADLVPGQVCAHVKAPLDYGHAAGHSPADTETVSLAVTRVPARGDKTGALLFIGGGPGLPGLNAVGMSYPDDVRDHFDIVTYDPRGVGQSTPAVNCPTDSASTSDDQVAKTESDNRAEVAGCLRGTGPQVLRHIGSDEATNDVDLIRAVLGEEKINILAASYGTQVAAMYASRYPHHYRAVVLDGVVDVSQTQEQMLIDQQRGYQDTFNRVAALCAGSYRDGGAECPLGEDPAKSENVFHQILRDADANPVAAGGGQTVVATDIINALTKSFLWPTEWPPFLEALNGVRAGDGAAMLRLATGKLDAPETSAADRAPRREPASGDTAGNAAFDAITCADTAEPTTDRAARQQRAEALYDASTYDKYLPRPTEFPLGVCDLWPSAGVVKAYQPTRVDGSGPLLFVSTRHDPATPYANGERMAKYFNSSLLTREGDGHTFVFNDINRCIDDEVGKYLQDPESVGSKTCQ